MMFTRRDVAEIVAFLALFVALVAAVVFSHNDSGRDLHSTWPESAEFSQLVSGQERFSEHATNADGLTVAVDHRTGVQYLVTATGTCPLLDVDGSPLRVMEASDDGK